MELRTILVHLDGGRHAPQCMAYAGALAIQFDAQLHGLAPTGWAVPPPPDGIRVAGLKADQQAVMRTLMEQAESCVRRFKEKTAALGVRKVCAKVEVGHDGEAMTAAARYCDLTVVTRTDAHAHRPPRSPRMPEDVLMGSGRQQAGRGSSDTRLNAGQAILERADEAGGDLIVAGGYGHSRIGEAVFGGATRTLLRSAPVPVLFSH